MAEPLYDDCTRRLSALAGAPDEWDARARFPVVNSPFVVGPSSGRTMAAASGARSLISKFDGGKRG